jgi:predicted HicB family RNase H-like nuclease
MAKTERRPLTFEEDPAPLTAARSAPRANPAVKEQRQQLGARVPTATYRRLKARAALQGVTVATLVEQAIAEFLTNHPD